MQETIFKMRYFERKLSKSLEKVYFTFFLNSITFNGLKPGKGPGTSDHSLFRLRNKFRKMLLLVMYYMTKFVNVI